MQQFHPPTGQSTTHQCDDDHQSAHSPCRGLPTHTHLACLLASSGSLFGPQESTAIDMMHLGMNGYHLIDDHAYKLSDLAQSPGDSFGFLYDMGDRFSHTVTVVSVANASDSDGSVVVLDGAMACPPEDGHGNTK